MCFREMGHEDMNQQLVNGAHLQVGIVLFTYLLLSKEYVAGWDVILRGTYVSETFF